MKTLFSRCFLSETVGRTGRLLVLLALTLGLSARAQIIITPNMVAGFPDGDISRSGHDGYWVYNAIDGDTTTWTYVTNPWTSPHPDYLAVGFNSQLTYGLRVWKDTEDGGAWMRKWDLTIDYTNDTGPLAERTWTRVTNLTNGFNGTELWTATSVNADGTIINDQQNSVPWGGSPGTGWASLTFDPVAATGVRIGFDAYDYYPGYGNLSDYHVAEFQVYGSGVPEPAAGALLAGLGALGCAAWRRRQFALAVAARL